MAEEARKVAERLDEASSKTLMLEIAEGYERLATLVEKPKEKGDAG